MEDVVEKIAMAQYPVYKETGIKYLGVIPENWSLKKGKWLFAKQERLIKDEDEIVTCFRDGTVTLRSNRKID